ncbi:PAS domain-containing protein [bacterium]|nr:PAS domain-containing protein [bacterium]
MAKHRSQTDREDRDRRDERQRELTAWAFRSAADGVYVVDEQRRILAMNPAALRTLGKRLDEVLGKPCHDVLRLNICREDCALRAARDAGEPIVNRPAEILHRDGRRTQTILSSAVLRDDDGRDVGGVETFRDLSRVRPGLGGRPGDLPTGILTVDPGMRELLELVPTLAASESCILLTGETGTGKSLLARAIHDQSPRSARPFVTVNCAALPESLLESELFGYRAGAFTGASRDRPGRIAAAEGGTMFLDEIGDIPLPIQVKLLRFLQDRSYERLGDDTTRLADVRVLVATHRDLGAMVARGEFRQDLYYRINVINLKLPALRERPADIPLLVERFLESFSNRRGKQVTGVTAEVLDALQGLAYRGNVRELENIIEHAYVLCPGPTVELAHLPPRVRGPAAVASTRPANLRENEAAFLREELARHGWNRTETAAALGMHRTTLQRKIRDLRIDLPATDGRRRRDRTDEP